MLLQAANEVTSGRQYTVSAVSGERQAPPKTEDGTDTEDVAPASLEMVHQYVRVHTGSMPGDPELLKTNEQPGSLLAAAVVAAAAAAGAAEAPPGCSSADAWVVLSSGGGVRWGARWRARGGTQLWLMCMH
jgi:hypothetical protein